VVTVLQPVKAPITAVASTPAQSRRLIKYGFLDIKAFISG
jgi:hypothetical protein